MMDVCVQRDNVVHDGRIVSSLAGAIPPLAWDDAMQVINGSCMSARSRIRERAPHPTEFECLYLLIHVKISETSA
jgi:hypothetical protein